MRELLLKVMSIEDFEVDEETGHSIPILVFIDNKGKTNKDRHHEKRALTCHSGLAERCCFWIFVSSIGTLTWAKID